MIGTSDQSCWLAEACKILLLLVVLQDSAKKVGTRPPSFQARQSGDQTLCDQRKRC